MIIKKRSRIVLLILLGFGMLAKNGIAVDEHIWIHVEGKYMRTSPYANPPNEIFVGVGMCYREHTFNGTHQEILDWAKARNVNTIRLSIYAYADYNFNNPASIISNDIDPWIQMAKSNQIYTYLDCHEYMHEFLIPDDWFPDGPLWDTATFQKWFDYWVAVATYYENEPWVLGYELCNEPCFIDPDFSRTKHIECIQAIRQVDTKHIILVGNNNYSHTRNMEIVWAPVDFMPDTPYNQMSFVFHEYPNADNPDITQPILDNIQDTYNVSVFCTEFGAMAVVGGVTEAIMRQFETDMFAMMGPRKIGWSIYVLNGTCPDDGVLKHEDIWVPAAADQGSDIPSSSGVVPQANKIVCGTYPEYVRFHGGILNYIIADGTSVTTVKATICDGYGSRMPTATDLVSFSISGEGRWDEDGTTGVKSVNAQDGIATIKVRSTSTPGTVTVNASAGVLTSGSVQIATFGSPNKLSCNADPASIPADGASLSHVSATIEDSLGNAIPIAQNAVTFSLEGTGSLWMTEELPGSTGVMEDGVGNIFVKAGVSIDEVIKVTASADGLISGSVNVYVGDVEEPTDPDGNGDDNPFSNVKVYPNPFTFDDASDKMAFTSLPGESVLKIYTLSGKLVRTLQEDGSGEITWDGKDSGGADVGKGIYIYLLSSQKDGSKKKGRITITR
jgi:flagellar hook assembly protein FlgD